MSNVKHEMRIVQFFIGTAFSVVYPANTRLTPHIIVLQPAPTKAAAPPTVRTTTAIGGTVTPATTVTGNTAAAKVVAPQIPQASIAAPVVPTPTKNPPMAPLVTAPESSATAGGAPLNCSHYL